MLTIRAVLCGVYIRAPPLFLFLKFSCVTVARIPEKAATDNSRLVDSLLYIGFSAAEGSRYVLRVPRDRNTVVFFDPFKAE